MLLLFKRRFTLPPSSLTTTEASRLAWCEGSVYLIFLARSCKQWCTCCKHLSTNCIDTIKKFRIFCTMLDISIQNQGPWSSVKKFYIIWSLNNTMWSTVIGVTKHNFIRRRHGLHFDTVYIEVESLALIISPFDMVWSIWSVLRTFKSICVLVKHSPAQSGLSCLRLHSPRLSFHLSEKQLNATPSSQCKHILLRK